MIKNAKYILLAISAIFIFSSCDDDENEQALKDDQIIQTYLEENNIEAKKHSSGLYFKILKEGNGLHPNTYSTVEVYYKGYLTNGTVFDETGGKSIQFSLMNVIEGWQIGIPLLREGGKGQFFIPSELAYGDRSTGSIPANSVLIFEVDLISVR